MANLHDRIVAGVAELSSAKDAAVQLVHNLADEIRANAGNPAALESMAAALKRDAAQVGDAVMANVHTVIAHVAPSVKEGAAQIADLFDALEAEQKRRWDAKAAAEEAAHDARNAAQAAALEPATTEPASAQ